MTRLLMALPILLLALGCSGGILSGGGRDTSPEPLQPALVPLPIELEWKAGSFSLKRSIRIVCDVEAGDEVRTTCAALGDELSTAGAPDIEIVVGDPLHPDDGGIGLAVIPIPGTKDCPEAYILNVEADTIVLASCSPEGLFRGTQTIKQLVVGSVIAGCRIADRPAFRMRGLMFDVGRNFISLPTIEQYIDVMALYKLNIFHFHLTEHIGWRLEIESHPELTAPEHQIRNKGCFYTHDEIREFVAFCKKRHVLVIPEIDMPGHSAAFERATGHSMQSPEGMAILEVVLEEVCTLFDGPFIHLGSDEVKIENPDFIPEMAKIVRRYGKEVVLWRPGGPLDEQAVYQLWHNGQPFGAARMIDSRDLYANHLDCFSGVARAFNKQLCGTNRGSDRALGGVVCLWPDRRVEHEQDQFCMSPVAPLLLTFSERAWRGGGYPELKRSLGADGSAVLAEFAELERRLVDHRERFFDEMPFTYVKQADVVWNIYGPFPNEGDLERAFPPGPDTDRAVFDDRKPVAARGATVFLGGWYDHGLFGKTQNHTVYGETFVHSARECDAHMWIGFRSWSRSHRDATPAAGQWDHRRSRIWLNGEPIPPPEWAKPGRKGHLEDPLIDEGYAYRPPTPIHLKKGWNHILVKAPVGKDAVKWMFTAVPVAWDGMRARELEGITFSRKIKDM